MKKALIIFGVIILVLILAVGGFIAYSVHQGSGFDISSRAYVAQAVPAVVSTWSQDALLERASPQLRQILRQKSDEIDRLFTMFSRLGALKHLDKIKGQSHIVYLVGKGKTITADYAVPAQFAQGKALIKLRLIQNDGQWQILSFNVNSPAFLPASP